MRRFLPVFLLAAALAAPARAVVIDRIAATIDKDVISLSQVEQVIELRVVPRDPGESEVAYRRRVLDRLIAQALRYRDVQRFGAQDVPADSIEARLLEAQKRFASPEEFQAALERTELTLDEVRALIKRQLQVEAYVAERFSPLIFVSLDEIEAYYRTTWLPQRLARNLPAVPLSDAREEIRGLLKAERLKQEIDTWTAQLRARANVDIYAFR